MKMNPLSILARYIHTIRYLLPIQFYGRLKFKLHKPKVNLQPQPLMRHRLESYQTPILKHAHMLSATKVVFLNEVQDISSTLIWDDNKLEKLWLYNLHYFDLLHSQFQNNQTAWQINLINRWIAENPPAKGNGWESYTISLRIVNWIKWIIIHNHANPTVLHSIAVQVRYLYKRLEIHLLANHLLSNAKALIFAGLFFAGEEAEAWLRKGLRIFNHEMKKQMLADGGHIELSPMYHSMMLENLLDCINLYQAYGKAIPAQWQTYSQAMFAWLRCMCHVDADISFFNDAAFGVAPSLKELVEYHARLNIAIQNTTVMDSAGGLRSRVTHLKASGFCRIQYDNMLLIADVAPIGADYQPGHGHADALSFEMSVHGQRLFINSGTSTYSENHERLRQRSTKAHNTVVIDDRNSSDVWKSFRVAKRAKVFAIKVMEEQNGVSLSASHDGYYQHNKIIHTRTWKASENKVLITDVIKGNGEHKIQIMFYVHPQIKVMQHDDYHLHFYNKHNIRFASLSVDHRVKLISSTYHPEFNVSIPNKLIMVESKQTLPADFHALIEWN